MLDAVLHIQAILFHPVYNGVDPLFRPLYIHYYAHYNMTELANYFALALTDLEHTRLPTLFWCRSIVARLGAAVRFPGSMSLQE